ncbi:hypothetical protein PG993_008929 [Apiospora rasikravindrae]|uniref:Uncharacterized protein n=1 Tax=Apiospora rasikravindrae TaxID=990691 RepID=A0ABR1SPQ8_9PEZI
MGRRPVRVKSRGGFATALPPDGRRANPSVGRWKPHAREYLEQSNKPSGFQSTSGRNAVAGDEKQPPPGRGYTNVGCPMGPSQLDGAQAGQANTPLPNASEQSLIRQAVDEADYAKELANPAPNKACAWNGPFDNFQALPGAE